MFRVGVEHHVDRVALRPAAGEKCSEFAARTGRQLCQRDIEFLGLVKCHHRRAATVADDGQTIAARLSRRRQRTCGGEHVADGAYAQHAGTAQGGIEGVIAVDTGAAVRFGNASRGRPLPGLDGNHRLDTGGGTNGAEKAARIAQPFEVEQDAFGLRVAGEVVENFRQFDVAGFAGGEYRREAELLVVVPVEDVGADRRRLGDQCQVAGGRCLGDRRQVQPGMRQDVAERVGSVETDAVPRGSLLQLCACRRFRPQAAGNDHCGSDASAAAGVEGGCDAVRRHVQYRQREGRADLVKRAMTRNAFGSPCLLRNQKGPAGERAVFEVAQQPMPERSGLRVGSKNSDTGGRQKRLKRCPVR